MRPRFGRCGSSWNRGVPPGRRMEELKQCLGESEQKLYESQKRVQQLEERVRELIAELDQKASAPTLTSVPPPPPPPPPAPHHHLHRSTHSGLSWHSLRAAERQLHQLQPIQKRRKISCRQN
ncbi:hypothetical protein MTO96_032075 [Rhipicephalus appendiculatus]